MLSCTLIALTSTEGRSAILPPDYDIVWSAIIFAIIMFVMVKFALPKYNELADERAAKIQEGIDLAEQAELKLRENEQRVEQEIKAARAEAAKIRDEANNQASHIIATAQEKSNEEAKRILDNAQRQIEAEKQSAEVSLRSDVGLLAVELAEKIVGEQLSDRELSARVVDRFLDELEQQTPAKVGEN